MGEWSRSFDNGALIRPGARLLVWLGLAWVGWPLSWAMHHAESDWANQAKAKAVETADSTKKKINQTTGRMRQKAEKARDAIQRKPGTSSSTNRRRDRSDNRI